MVLGAIFPTIAEASSKPVAVFYVPNQGDEQTVLGASILRHVKSNNVHVVLLTKPKNKQTFINDIKKMGVKQNQIHFANLNKSDTTIEKVKNIIQSYEKKYPNARHKTMTYIDDHHDHRNAGQALLQLYNEGKVKDARFYIQDLHRVKEKKHWKENYKSSYYTKIKNAATSYMTYNPEKNQYAIGYTSVRGHFDNLLKNPVSYYHLPNF